MCRDNQITIIIDEKLEGTRIDMALSLAYEDRSRSFFQKLLDTENITVNGQVTESKKYKVKAGDIIQVTMPEPKLLAVEPENIPLEMVYEDEDVLVINKPKGMVVHPANGNESGTLVNAVMYHCGKNLSSINGVRGLYIELIKAPAVC